MVRTRTLGDPVAVRLPLQIDALVKAEAQRRGISAGRYLALVVLQHLAGQHPAATVYVHGTMSADLLAALVRLGVVQEGDDVYPEAQRKG